MPQAGAIQGIFFNKPCGLTYHTHTMQAADDPLPHASLENIFASLISEMILLLYQRCFESCYLGMMTRGRFT